MSFGRRKAIVERYEETVQVDVDESDGDVCLSTTQSSRVTLMGGGPGKLCLSSLTPEQAEDLAEQLRAAAAYARTRGRA